MRFLRESQSLVNSSYPPTFKESWGHHTKVPSKNNVH